MPGTKTFNIDTSKPVLVTGATGYVAGVLVSQLLDEGVTVHATVRDPSNKDHIQYLQDLAESKKGSIKFFKGDLLDNGSFDEAAKGCHIIFHTASPFMTSASDPMKELVEPAVKGTENVLTTASQTPSVRRVVLTSSVVAIYGDASDADSLPGGAFTEEVWNRTSTLATGPYFLSKTLAEQKAWVMAGSQTQWSMVAINPAMVFGPGLKYHASSESYKLLTTIGGGTMKSGAPQIPIGVVDVRDVAAAHIAAAYSPEATGRHICCGHNTNFPEIGKVLAEKYPPPKYPVPTSTLSVPKFLFWILGPYLGLSRHFISKNLGYSMNFDNTKARKELGIDFYPLSTTLHEMYQQMLDAKAIETKS
ncbi:hypothetical protein ACA910_016018 [Epithemia clementina (nom. ined.)]